MTFAGFPAAITFSGIFLVTTEPLPITEFSPMETPFKIETFEPINTFLQI